MHGRPEVIVGSDEDQAIRQVVATGMNQLRGGGNVRAFISVRCV